MKFTTDELLPFSDVRTHLSKYVEDVECGQELVVTRHGKPIAALISAQRLYRYREFARLTGKLAVELQTAQIEPSPNSSLTQLVFELEKLLSEHREIIQIN